MKEAGGTVRIDGKITGWVQRWLPRLLALVWAAWAAATAVAYIDMVPQQLAAVDGAISAPRVAPVGYRRHPPRRRSARAILRARRGAYHSPMVTNHRHDHHHCRAGRMDGGVFRGRATWLGKRQELRHAARHGSFLHVDNRP